jgi:rubredoxin
MERYKCVICGFIYDPEEGDPSSGIEPGTEFSDLPPGYLCPVCSAGKDEFYVYD